MGRGLRGTVWATGFSVAQTGKSVAQSVAALCVSRSTNGVVASICAVMALHVVG